MGPDPHAGSQPQHRTEGGQVNTIKLNNIEKIAQGRLSGFSPNYVQDTRTAAKWLIELVQEVKRLNNQRSVYRARVKALHKLLAKVDSEGENSGPDSDWDTGFLDGRYQLAEEIKKIFVAEGKE